MFKQIVLDTIKKYRLIESGDRVVIGVSGGPDSVCLLHVLSSLAEQLQIKLFAVHVNHMLRGEEARQDEDYVRKLCREMEIDFFTKSVDVSEISKKKKISLEEAGREARYSQFEFFAHKLEANKIAVAHNRNDQAETVLMRIIRGTGLDGLLGMDYKRGNVIRPLLNMERKSIEEYCRDNNLTPRTDSSNLAGIYTRNKVRLSLIPYIDGLFGADTAQSISKLTSLLKDDYDFIEAAVNELYNKSVIRSENSTVLLDISRLITYLPSARRRIIRRAIEEVKGDLTGIGYVHVEKVLELVLAGQTGTVIHLPANIRVGRSYNELKLFMETEAGNPRHFDRVLNIPGHTIIKEINATVEAGLEEYQVALEQSLTCGSDSPVQYFDYEKLKTGINIRNRLDGDIFKPLKSNGTKKLKEYFIDCKIPRDKRDEIPVIAAGNEVIWIVGYKISDKFKVTENTKCVLKLKFDS